MLPEIPVHIVQRGNNRISCFFAEQDRRFYLFQLGRMLRQCGCALHAYCLMTNHVHLLVTAADVRGCAQLMKHVSQLHTQYVNRTYGRSGTLWEGRFRSCLVQSEEYVLACYRYIECNPARAGIAEHPRSHPWSSYRANACGTYNALITPHAEYLRLGRDDSQRREAYTALVDCQLEPKSITKIREATNGNFALGDKEFRDALARALGKRVERGTPGRPGRAQGSTGPDLLGSEENVVCP